MPYVQLAELRGKRNCFLDCGFRAVRQAEEERTGVSVSNHKLNGEFAFRPVLVRRAADQNTGCEARNAQIRPPGYAWPQKVAAQDQNGVGMLRGIGFHQELPQGCQSGRKTADRKHHDAGACNSRTWSLPE